MRGVRPISVKEVLFYLSGCDNDAILNFISDSSSCISGFSNDVSFVLGFFLEGGQNSKT